LEKKKMAEGFHRSKKRHIEVQSEHEEVISGGGSWDGKKSSLPPAMGTFWGSDSRGGGGNPIACRN